MTEVVTPWRLNRHQTELFKSSSRYLVLVAGRRWGKTIFAVTWLVHEVASRGDGAIGYYVLPFRVMAKAIAWDVLLKVTKGIRTKNGVNSSELTVKLLSGGTIALKGADDPETLEGVGLVAVVLDEFARMKYSAWTSSIRPALSDKRGRALFCGKPKGFNHLHELFLRGQSDGVEWRSWHYDTASGGQVSAEDIAEAKSTLPPKVFRQEYGASFENAAGRVYDSFDRSCIIYGDQLRREWHNGSRWLFKRIICAGDWGYNNPGVVLVLGVTATGRVYVIHEEYHRELIVDAGKGQWLEKFTEVKQKFKPECFVFDPSEPAYIRKVRLHFGGDPIVYNAHNEVSEGILEVSSLLMSRNLFVSSECVNTIREFNSYLWAETKDGNSKEEPIKESDHAMDALRYGIMHLRYGKQ